MSICFGEKARVPSAERYNHRDSSAPQDGPFIQPVRFAKEYVRTVVVHERAFAASPLYKGRDRQQLAKQTVVRSANSFIVRKAAFQVVNVFLVEDHVAAWRAELAE
ncbi:hypothetical protein VE26_02215 [Devosia chinhatensis]|uniref:Uncharacterized protein n=1 Tax=Devosia chinhatensis TaxID=429727 RepID=A0A0F5FJ65_9HYPH|nr:hypothetical protein VE26_02215 [Devosia chinhatensis]